MNRTQLDRQQRLEEVQQNVSIVIKTFERPFCLQRLVQSIRTYYDAIPIIVVDDGKQALSPPFPEISEYYHLPFDSGLSYGRNFALQKVKTKYFVMSDDDFVFTAKTALGKMYEILETTAFSLVSCNMVDHIANTKLRLGVRRVEGTIDLDHGIYRHTYDANRGIEDGLPVYEVLHNFFMAETSKVGSNAWDERIKIGHEHGDFFLTMRERGLRCTKVEDVSVYHYSRLPSHYKKHRQRDAGEYFQIWRRKRGIAKEIFAGNYYRRSDRIKYFYNHLLRNYYHRSSLVRKLTLYLAGRHYRQNVK